MPKRQVTDAQIRQIRLLWEAGKTAKQIAEIVGLKNWRTVYNYVGKPNRWRILHTTAPKG